MLDFAVLSKIGMHFQLLLQVELEWFYEFRAAFQVHES
jgi:hypothetical protein